LVVVLDVMSSVLHQWHQFFFRTWFVNSGATACALRLTIAGLPAPGDGEVSPRAQSLWTSL